MCYTIGHRDLGCIFLAFNSAGSSAQFVFDVIEPLRSRFARGASNAIGCATADCF